MRGYFKLTVDIWDDEDSDKTYEPNDTDRKQIAEMIEQGYTEGEVNHEE